MQCLLECLARDSKDKGGCLGPRSKHLRSFPCASARSCAHHEDGTVGKQITKPVAGDGAVPEGSPNKSEPARSQAVPILCAAWLACVVGSAVAPKWCVVVIVAGCAAAGAAGLGLRTQSTKQEAAARATDTSSSGTCSQIAARAKQYAYPDPSLPFLRPVFDKSYKMPDIVKNPALDPYFAQRLNYLGGSSVPFEPSLAALNDMQRECFYELETTFPDVLKAEKNLDRTKFYQEPDRHTLLIFLQADCYNVKKASERLRKTILWRQQSGFEDFIDNPDMEAWLTYWRVRPRRVLGYDKRGYVVSVEPLGQWLGGEGSPSAMSMEKWLLCYAFDMSLQQRAFRESSIKHNRPIHRLAYIGDLAGINLGTTIQRVGFLRCLLSIEMAFPECAADVILINAPKAVTVPLNMAKRFMDPRITEKVSVHEGVPVDYLREKFGPEGLPKAYGGCMDFPLIPTMPVEQARQEVKSILHEEH
eukprot:TRINITY_DN74883_c0_g1_i1.p1 TRINITY_DN74883_c0_g1~~TRINITY_DN74883_c0_g1_i1.p1  ORF type:complete len:502 (+),score=84.17 TRINITY_DN74883_c0_g1_i1:86-1507(+)